MTPDDATKSRSGRGNEVGSAKPGPLATVAPTGAADDDSPGVPGFRTWRSVYWFVLAWFVACVLGLTLLTRVFR
jgi:hypothetical protein